MKSKTMAVSALDMLLLSLCVAVPVPLNRSPSPARSDRAFELCPHHVAGFAASLITTLWDRREALHQSRLVETATSFPLLYRLQPGNFRLRA